MRSLKLITSSIFLLLAGIVPVAAQGQPVAVAPMRFRGLMPVIEVKLNGQGPFVFMIDTGAGMQADIDTSVATQLKLQPNGRVLNGDPSGENDREVNTARIDSITLGGVEFRNVTAVIRPQRITKDYPEVDGILGFALFTDYLLTLDYPALQVRLARGALPTANGADILSFEIENRIPVIEEPQIRRYLLTRFPYSIYYRWEPEQDRVSIYAVMHFSRRPGYWRKRVPE